MVIFRLLGPVSVSGQPDGESPIATPRVRALLVALLRHPDQHVPLGRLAEYVWATPPASAQANMRTHIAALRKALDRSSPGLGQRLQTRRGSGGGEGAYRLVAEPEEVDASLFTSLAEQGQHLLASKAPLAAAKAVKAALRLWHGPIGEDLPDTLPLRSWAATLTERWLTAREDLAEARLMLEDHAGLVAGLRHHAAESPFRERPVELLMRALHATGDRSSAIRAFHSFRVRLVNELGMEPSARLQKVHLTLLRDEPILHPLLRDATNTAPRLKPSPRRIA